MAAARSVESAATEATSAKRLPASRTARSHDAEPRGHAEWHRVTMTTKKAYAARNARASSVARSTSARDAAKPAVPSQTNARLAPTTVMTWPHLGPTRNCQRKVEMSGFPQVEMSGLHPASRWMQLPAFGAFASDNSRFLNPPDRGFAAIASSTPPDRTRTKAAAAISASGAGQRAASCRWSCPIRDW